MAIYFCLSDLQILQMLHFLLGLECIKSLVSNISLWVANAQGLYVCLLQFSILKCEKILKKMIQFSMMCFKHNMHLEFLHVQFL